MKLKRREAIALTGGLAGAAVLGCSDDGGDGSAGSGGSEGDGDGDAGGTGGDDGTPGDGDGDGAACESVEVDVEVTTHGHTLEVPAEDVEAGAEMTYTTEPDATGHSHDLTVTADRRLRRPSKR